jgi:glutamate dehydrogenase/leucine dehydrogenase
MAEHGTLLNYPKATAATDSPTDFMTNECDILIPAATEKSIH